MHRLPTPANDTVAPAGTLPGTPATENAVTARLLPASTSLSLANTPLAADVTSGRSSAVLRLSATATGVSLPGSITRLTVAVLLPPRPSETV